MKKIFVLLLVITTQQFLYAQGVKIGGAGNPDATAILELDGSSGKGLLLPRLTSTQMSALAATDGMLIYNTTDLSLYIRKNNAWQKIAEGTPSSGFQVPYSSTHDLPGQYVLDITNTGQGASTGTIKGVATGTGNGVVGYSEKANGIVGSSNSGSGGYFSSTTGAAITTGSGNVGIGTAAPVKARIHVNGTIGAVSALFENGPGIAIENNHPGIGFNTYYNEGRKNIAAGYGGAISLNPSNGDLGILTSEATGSADAVNPVFTRLLINKNGNIGVGGNVAPHSPLSFSDALGNKVAFWGNAVNSHYGIGIQPNMMQLYSASQNDNIAFGVGSSSSFTEHMRIRGNGNVGIGTVSPAYRLTVAADGNGIVHTGNGVEIGTSVSALGGMVRTFTNHSLRFGAGTTNVAHMLLTPTGELGVGTALPAAKLHVSWNNQHVQQLDNTNALAADQKVNTTFRTGSYFTGAIGTTGTSGSKARLSFYTGSSLTSSSLTEKMSIDDNGNVGINTTTPTAKLNVKGKTVLEQGTDNAALEVKGEIRMPGDVNSPLFRVTVWSNTKVVVIDNPVCNGDPTAYLFITANTSTPYKIDYNVSTQKWEIKTSGEYVSGFSVLGLQRCDINKCQNIKLLSASEHGFGYGDWFNVMVVKK